ncbi:hypothetical protein Pint_21956 [Pistacia integerrima]|uniref:Uncharacterized protein n=1 Tax=Pistacia integerrima TaxID=434235 RepID=A0ACC0YP10_9ROSI|nr:hypothetical protein Pint_21956 [Pistacia integerrima]
MRMSCNGCRILRKGCSDDCTIKPCLDWIKSSDSQANATLFLAKFYGRAGLINLIEAGPQHLRPGICIYPYLGRFCMRLVGGLWIRYRVQQGCFGQGNGFNAKRLLKPSSKANPSSKTLLHLLILLPFHQQLLLLLLQFLLHYTRFPLLSRSTTSAMFRRNPISSSDLTTTTKTPRMKRSWNRRPKAPAATDSTGGRAYPGLDSSIWLTPLGNAESSAETVEGSRSSVGLELTLGLISSSNEIVKE